MDLVALPRDRCPDCGELLERTVVHQPTLFWFLGQGGDQRTVVAHCTCGYLRIAEIGDVRPLRESTAP
jgi:hypothetical protein